MKNTMNSGVSKALRNIVAERDSYTCVLCENGYTDIHHVTPRSHGGRTNPQNLVCLCRRCHMMLHRQLPLDSHWRKFGWDDAAEWVEYADQRMIEYVADFYAFDGLDVPGPIDHDSFTPYGSALYSHKGECLYPRYHVAPDGNMYGHRWNKERQAWDVVRIDGIID